MADLHFTDLLQQLTALRSRFGKAHEEDKSRLLELLAGLQPHSKKDIIHYHELLLFFMTYPDSKEFFNKVVTAMGSLNDQLRQSSLQHPDKFSTQYDGSGVAFSSIDWKPTVDACKWLLRTYGSDVTLNWSDEFAGRIGPFLAFFCSRAEQDGLTNDRFDAKDWMMLASGAGEGQETEQLRYLVKKMESLQADAMLTDYIFDVLSPEVHIRLNHPLASRTTNIITCEKLFYQGEPLVRDFDPIKQLNKKIAPVKKLAAAEANKIIDVARAVLAVRCRETDPFSYAGEVRQADLERGLRLYLFSMIPERRMPLENYTGFLALRNGVPIGYGGGWILGERCEIGVNIFETFRGGENSYIFTNILRVYNRVFGIKLFAVPPYQFGADNDEGLKSGAFWFYYKLGFRPADESLALLAESEAQKIANDKKYHSSLKTLKRLAEYPLELKNGRTKFRLQPKQISIVITKWIAKNFNSDHEAANRWCINKLKALPGMKSMKGLSANEKISLNYLAIFLVLPDILDGLTHSEKTSLTDLIRLKGGDEISYSLLLREQSKLLKAWQRLVDDDLIS